MSGQFDPAKYLVKINNRGDYLEVKWRLLWLRTEHPDAHIETEAVSIDGDQAIFRARVSIPDGGSATGYGSETPNDFRDYIEKSETKAIGRALAALGFGTQFCQDHEFGADTGRIVDAPVEERGRRRARQHPQAGTRPASLTSGERATLERRFERVAAREEERAARQPGRGSPLDRATDRQVRFIRAIAGEAGLEADELETWSQELYGGAVDELKRRDASALIEALQRRKSERG